MSRFTFFEEEKNTNIVASQPEIIEQPADRQDISSEKYRYRVEQIIITKFNGQIISHGNTKQEYLVTKNSMNGLINNIGLELIENVVRFEPPQLETAIDLLCDVDKVKCNVSITPNLQSGKMSRIEDKSRVIVAWEQYKKDVVNKFSFLKSDEEWNNINTFMDMVEEQIHTDNLLLADYEAKMFFDLIFDKYLVSKEDFEPFTKYYLSNLFDHKLLLLDINQSVVQESPESITINQQGTLNKKDINKDNLIEMYNDKFKPYIGYSYTEYDYKYSNSYTLNTAGNVLQNANVVIIEEVKNNVQITVNYELKLVDL
ncbi:hypothetical protein AY601_2082 [Pedobacter cryoconitis]|uniref:Uncharacterized protein n=1 Tax=Pedobacter cryoconitis TaxID=188932 RepID=A0A127VC98_9SPHI|nr:hypothetical protein [Pedobacter cryoconitis]AMP98983.1 hypothetical protein AY601_2082 [Pedobacter cryoconitis]